MNDKYDSRPDTLKHIRNVQMNLSVFKKMLDERGIYHDKSKLESPEVEAFDKITTKLKDLVYGSPEYRANLAEIKDAIDHHNAHNRHHPEFHEKGIKGMSLLDIVEMFCDWWAATERSKGGDIRRSIYLNQTRFGYSDDLMEILLNTVEEMERY